MVPQGSGVLISTASIYGLVGAFAGSAHAYTAAKGALVNLTRTAAIQLAPHGIRVNAIAPGFVETNIGGGLLKGGRGGGLPGGDSPAHTAGPPGPVGGPKGGRGLPGLGRLPLYDRRHGRGRRRLARLVRDAGAAPLGAHGLSRGTAGLSFVVGVLCWSLRVSAYAVLLLTGRYPPFRLGD
jgi:NAD(P)-dependent dehydrogenase (short-subunit alcohol dehydrogenase family)